MVSFVCDSCQDTLKKAKVKTHVNRCYTSSVSCIDCGVSFSMKSYNSHNQCMTEKKKYAGELAQERISKQQDEVLIPADVAVIAAPKELVEAAATKLKSKKSEKSNKTDEVSLSDVQKAPKKKKKKAKKDKLKDIIKK